MPSPKWTNWRSIGTLTWIAVWAVLLLQLPPSNAETASGYSMFLVILGFPLSLFTAFALLAVPFFGVTAGLAVLAAVAYLQWFILVPALMSACGAVEQSK
ncbi:MAG: hypothetical protein JST93_32730 [Acidobacteria bacterium]|nr:hypothetical protein [Acidobacteriota bacterium]